MKLFKRISNCLLVVCVLMLCIGIRSHGVQANAEIAWEDKIEDAIWDSDPDENGERLIFITRKSISEAAIGERFETEFGYPISYYSDPVQYKKHVTSEIVDQSIVKYGLQDSVSIEYGRELLNDNMTPIEYESILDHNEYISNKRSVLTDLYMDSIDVFLDRNDIDPISVSYKGKYTGSIIMLASAEEIVDIAKDETVTGVYLMESSDSYFVPGIDETSDENSEFTSLREQADARRVDVTMGEVRSTSYNGSGIKIGILESNVGSEDSYGGRYESSHPQLAAIHNSRLFYLNNYYSFDGETREYVVNANQHYHASSVTALIVGQPVVINEVTYSGVVPNATVYQTTLCGEDNTLSPPHSGDTQSDMYLSYVSGLELLVDQGVSVINISAGGAQYGEYDLLCAETDAIAYSAGVLVVNSAGNNDQYISTPGMIMNGITVGNVVTNSSSGSTLSRPYSVSSNSSYQELNGSLYPNKPDLVAPGTYVPLVMANGTLDRTKSGTSFSAPLVAGLAAQLQQAKSELRDSVAKLKAIILAGAQYCYISGVGNSAQRLPIISTSNNPETAGNPFHREKSGVGLLNNTRALAIANGTNKYAQTVYTLTSSQVVRNVSLASVSLSAGQTIRIVLTYLKSDPGDRIELDGTQAYPINVDLTLNNSSGTIVASSTTTSNNVEVLEFTVNTAGTYSIYSKLLSYDTSYANRVVVAAAWYIE